MGEVDVSYGTILVLGGGYRAETWIKAGQNALAYGLSSAGAGTELTGISSERFYFSNNLDVSNILYTRGITFGNYGQTMVLPYTRGSPGEYLKLTQNGNIIWDKATSSNIENMTLSLEDLSSNLSTTDTFFFNNNLDVSNTVISKDVSCINIVCKDISCESLYFTKFSVPENTLNPNYYISDVCNNRTIVQTLFENFEIVEGYNDAVIGIGTGSRSNRIKNSSLTPGTYTPSNLKTEFNSFVKTNLSNSNITNCNFSIDISTNGYYNLKITVTDSNFGLLLTGSFMDYFTGTTNYNRIIQPSTVIDIISIYKPESKTIILSPGVYKFDSLMNEITTNTNFNSPDVTWDTLDNLFPQTVEIRNKNIHPYKLSGNFITYWTGNTTYTCNGRGLGEFGKTFMIRSNVFNSIGTMINDSVINTSRLNCTNLNVTNNANITGDVTIQGTGTIGGQNITSDKRLKHKIKNVDKGLEIINKLEPKTYFKSKDLNNIGKGRFEAGYLAQDISDKITDLSFIVQNSSIDSKEILSLDYNSIQPYLCKSIQELHKLVVMQQEQITELTAQLARK